MFITRAVAIATVALASVAGTAYGAKPDVVTFDDPPNTFVLTDVCAFPVTVTAQGSGTIRFHIDGQGDLTALEAHVVEQDTFSANGNTLVGEPYRFLDRLTFDAQGNLVKEQVTGVAERIRLPNGSLFISAGLLRPDVTNPAPGFSLAPDRGRTGDLSALCAALAA
jgi:hypothetical protein